MKKIFILSFILFIITSCKPIVTEKIVYKDKECSWKQDLRFSRGDDSILLNSFASDKKLNISAISHWATIDKQDNIEGTLNFEYYLNYSIKRKIPITDKIFTYYWEKQNYLVINSTSYPIASYIPYFDIKEYDTTFSRINDDGIDKKIEFMAITENMYCLFPYLTKSNEARFLIIRPNYKIHNDKLYVSPNTNTVFVKKVEADVFKNNSYLYFITSYYDNFFVNVGHKFYTIDTLGNVNKVLNHNIFQMINLSDSLIAIDANYQTYLSLDNGNSWEKFLAISCNDFSKSNGCYHNFEVIDNKIIAYPRCAVGQLYQLSIEDNNFKIDTIPSDGLELKDITSISEFNEKVYVTTLSGLFYKEIDKLLKYNN